MTAFTSKRETRLWGVAAAVWIAILGTIGLATTISSELRDRDLLDATFAAAFLAIVAALVAMGARVRLRGVEVGVAIGVAAVYLLVFVRMAVPEERSHLIEYGVLAALIYEALAERRNNGGHVPWPPLLAVVIGAALGFVDEAVQAAIPSRVFDLRDVGFNALASLMAVTGIAAVHRARRRARPG